MNIFTVAKKDMFSSVLKKTFPSPSDEGRGRKGRLSLTSERERFKISARISLQRDLKARAVRGWSAGTGKHYGYSGTFLNERQVSGLDSLSGCPKTNGKTCGGCGRIGDTESRQRPPVSNTGVKLTSRTSDRANSTERIKNGKVYGR